jgi:hypothetical protein
MLRPSQSLPRRSFATITALGALLSSCAVDPVREVVSVVPGELSFSMEITSNEPPVPKARSLEEALAGGEVALPVGAGHQMESLEDHLQATLGSGTTQLNPELGPMDLGYPLLIDLGAGEAPYDDGVRTIHGVELTRGGFSDAVVQASWRESVTPSSMLHATVALTRLQDLGLIEGAAEMRFTWLVVGWKTSL